MQFREHDKSANYVTRLTMLAQCDYWQERDENPDLVQLIHLQEEQLQGGSSDLRAIAQLQMSLGIESTMQLRASSQYKPGYRHSVWVTLRVPYGDKHRTIEVNDSDYNRAGEIWDNNPIDTARISLYGKLPTLSELRSNRLSRVDSITFSGLRSSRNVDTMSLLLELGKSMSATRLHLPGFNVNNLLPMFKRTWRNLISVDMTE
jgi:hypothetical protein